MMNRLAAPLERLQRVNANGRRCVALGLFRHVAVALVLTLGIMLGAMGTTSAQDAQDPCAAYLSATPDGEHGGDHGTGHGHAGHDSDGATPAAGPAGDAHAGHATSGASVAASPAAELPSLDLAFIDLMVPHHEGAVLMSEIALVRAEREEVMTLAESIISEQTAEQEQMRAWRAEWFADAPDYSEAELMAVFDMAMAEMDMPADHGGLEHLAPADDAAALCAAEGPFDLAFIDRMMMHHQAAIDMANVVVVSGEREELRSFAQNVIAAQQEELDQMAIWRSEWFGATPVASPAG